MDFQRARSEDQIQNRIQEIVDAVSSIYSSVGYEGLNFSIISKYTKFTRPSIYKYFKTKDEILLVILKDEFKSFVSDLITSFKINKLYSLYEISEIWTDRFIEHKKILDLYSILYTAIEKNVSLELLVETKKELNMINSQLADFIGQLFPSASNDSITNFIASMLSLAGGIYSMSNLSDLQLEAIKLSGLDYTTLDFKKEFMASIYQQMYCLKNSIEVKKE
ncbi:TetR family transcriptional regulator [Clostridium chromiireducens]|uniref:TetR family transcriptional regulator n=1 Tax=Clostridium chromiireducens TaxID=225345 RepID=A0A964W2M3_9CLOT|nr:TetR family transcriptional regulator [Clostridium chromiireducens]MVX64283.1 TetR family transcriptional regulator [Clostridium chromiireducens]